MASHVTCNNSLWGWALHVGSMTAERAMHKGSHLEGGTADFLDHSQPIVRPRSGRMFHPPPPAIGRPFNNLLSCAEDSGDFAIQPHIDSYHGALLAECASKILCLRRRH